MAAGRSCCALSGRHPRIVAESLLDVCDPLETALDPGRPLDHLTVIRGLARSVAPPEADLPAPPWLRADQAIQFRRVVAALTRHGGALLADPVGSGKSWIALAAAQAIESPGAIAVIAPAILRAQWSAVAARASVSIAFTSHEKVSRGSLPDESVRLLILDESHRFRTPATRRYRTLAPWLVGRTGLLLSATPVVNRLEDLAHQLLLVLRDDALWTRGCPSLHASLVSGSPSPSLGEVVVQREAGDGIPATRHRTIRPTRSRALGQLLRVLDRLALSQDAGTAALLRMALHRAVASSPAALAGMLRRYVGLLDHAAAAAAAGKPVSRATIRALTGPEPDQYLMWELLGGSGDRLDLELGERGTAVEALRAAEGEPGVCYGRDRLEPLRDLLSDRAPTVVFTASRDTLGWLRAELHAMVPAWITGDEAGIGPARLPRESVLGWFGPGAPASSGLRVPHLLLATDVAAEGLDLQRAGRVVHFDLPWTEVRLEQRAGRARRLGAVNSVVEIVTVLPGVSVERRIRQLERLQRKRGLTAKAGLDRTAQWLFRWRADLAAWAGTGVAGPGCAIVLGPESGWLVGLALAPLGEGPAPAILFWFGEDGRETAHPAEVVPKLLQVAESAPADGGLEWQRLRPRFLAATRALLARTAGAAWSITPVRPARRETIRRLRAMARRANALRDLASLGRIDRAMITMESGFSAGEAMLADQAAALPDEAMLRQLERLPPRRSPMVPPRPVVTGIVRVTSFPA